jgi:hypothetical protein
MCIYTERNLLNVSWHNEWWPRKVLQNIIEFSYFQINLLGYLKWTVLQPQYKLRIKVADILHFDG